jgi:uncharacterized damage-inducible protein DinB
MTPDYFRTFARYNQWANRRLYAAVAELPEAEIAKPRPAFFKSLLGTLNHILVGDRVWMGRFTGHEHGIKTLDQILYGDFVGLRVAREAEDAQIIEYADQLNERTVNSTLRYKTMTGGPHPQSTPLRFTLAHFFNHQTHHRGQAHDQLTQTSVAPPSLDLMHYLRESGVTTE